MSSALFGDDLTDETKPRYQALSAVTEQWTKACIDTGDLGEVSFKRVAADLFTMDTVTQLYTVIHVALVFDTKNAPSKDVPRQDGIRTVIKGCKYILPIVSAVAVRRNVATVQRCNGTTVETEALSWGARGCKFFLFFFVGCEYECKDEIRICDRKWFYHVNF